MLLNLGWEPRGEQTAEVHGHDAVCEVHDQAHVVLDQDHRDVEFAADVEDESRHVLGLLGVHTGDRLVEQQQLGFHRQRPTELDALLDAVREHADREVAIGLDLEEVDDLLDLAAVADLFAAGLAQPDQCRRPSVLESVVPPKHQVVDDVEVAEQLDVLEGAGHPH